tara:strand:- start:727 stop:1110 length:384 start_codon:yes stop_codon:yes gene_type:complete
LEGGMALHMKEIQIIMDQNSVIIGSDITGAVTVNYNGRFDGIQVNTYVTGTSDQVFFTNVDGKTTSLLTRLYMSKDSIGDKKSFRFTARVEKILYKEARIRFRAAIIQEHKEIVSDTVFMSLNDNLR